MLKKLISFLKQKLFKSDSKSDHVENYDIKASTDIDFDKESFQEEIIEDSSEEKIAISYINWKFINTLQNYDIVTAKMLDKKIEEENISASHQKRPLIITIIEKKDGERIIMGNKGDHILEKDLIKLKKYRNFLSNQVVFSDYENRVIEIGDIVSSDNKNYIIYKIANNKCYGYAIFKKSNQLMFVDYSDHQKFDINSKISIVNYFGDSIVQLIRNNKKKLKSMKKYNNKIKKR